MRSVGTSSTEPGPPADDDVSPGSGRAERIVVAVTAAPGAERVIEQAITLARRLGCSLSGVAVAGASGFSDESSAGLRRHRERLTAAGATYHEVVGHDVASALAGFARAEQATHLVVGTSSTRWPRRSVAARIEALGDGLDVHIVGRHDRPRRVLRHTSAVSRGVGLSRRRQLIGLAVAAVSLPAATAVLTAWRGSLSQAMVFLLYLALVVVLAAIGGPVVGVVSAAVAFLLVNWFFTEPLHTLNVADAEGVTELIIFLAVSGTVAALVSAATRRAQQSLRLRTQASLLASAAGTAIGEVDPTQSLLDELRSAIGATSIGIDEVSAPPGPGAERLVLAGDMALIIHGTRLDEDTRVLARAFGDQIVGAMRTRSLARQAARAEQLRATNDLRSALLRAVSHDLRTPLASAKIATSSLLSTDVVWTDEIRHELLTTADGEIDRLILIVENLLDAGRLQSGAVVADVRATSLVQSVEGALASLAADDRARVTVEAPAELPDVLADGALTSRVLANLLANALAADRTGTIAVQIEPGPVARGTAVRSTDERGAWVEARIVDHGPGIPAERREAVFLPFQRFTDRSTGAGVGLGLAICAGFCEAMGVTLELDDTPSGGTTARLRFSADTTHLPPLVDEGQPPDGSPA